MAQEYEVISHGVFMALFEDISTTRDQIDGIAEWANADEITREILLETKLRGV